MSDTPRTDAECGDICGDAYMIKVPTHGDYVPSDLCRTLERELNAANAELARLRAGGCARDQKTTQFCAEAVELERKLEAWKAYAGRLEEAGNKMHWAFMHPFDVSHEMLVLRGWTAAKETKP